MRDVQRGYDTRAGRFRIPRSRGAMSGLLLVLLGLWGALIPFVGPYFNFAYNPNTPWTWTAARGWLEVLPGAVTVLGGLLVMVSANRATALFGGWLAVVERMADREAIARERADVEPADRDEREEPRGRRHLFGGSRRHHPIAH